MDELLARGSGNCEVQIQDHAYPVLSIAFNRGSSVVHCWWDAEHMSLLAGDGTVPRDTFVEIFVDGDDKDPSTFTGQFVSSPEHAKSILEKFLQDGDAEPLGDWFNL